MKDDTGIQIPQQLIAWQTAHTFVLAVFEACEALYEYNTLRQQMEKAAISVMSNIAEGFGRQTIPDKKHFYVIARGSIYELLNQIIIAHDRHIFSKESCSRLTELSTTALKTTTQSNPRLNKIKPQVNTMLPNY
ncbi:four helix bundle protein [Candidatus Saccharibacteria bacterium]|nr:four helix bundle protein [Candidatus Saccharibacteria bacterium]